MSVENKAVHKIAHLARIDIKEKDIPHYAKNMSDILDFVEKMNSVNTDQVQPLANPLDTNQRLREDNISESNHRDAFQKLAPAKEAGLYLVPKVIDAE